MPITWPGKIIASCCALLGISFFALPAVSIRPSLPGARPTRVTPADRKLPPKPQLNPGHPRQRLRPEGAATAAPEAYDPAPGAGRHFDPVPLALLCGRRELHVGGHLEDTSGPIAKSTCVSVSATRFYSWLAPIGAGSGPNWTQRWPAGLQLAAKGPQSHLRALGRSPAWLDPRPWSAEARPFARRAR